MGNPRVALVLGSGGLKCAASLGLWRVLQRENIPVDMAVGCSGGSMFAACLALGMSIQETQEFMRQGWTHRNLTRYHYRAVLQALFPRSFGFNRGFGLLDDRAFMQTLAQAYRDFTFAQTKIPLYLTATDMQTGEKVVLNQGRILDAVRASIAIPIIFSPKKIGERWLIDGGYRTRCR